jgi:alpha-glucoside transport system substrate-binding protein
MWKRTWYQTIASFCLTLVILIACSQQKEVKIEDIETKSTNYSLEILTAFNTKEAKIFKQAIRPFETATGIEIELRAASAEFANLVSVAANGLDVPDVAFFPQISLYKELVSQGVLQPLNEKLDNLVRINFPEDLNEAIAIDGKLHGIWLKNSLKSLVWYRRDLFEKLGYTVPKTWAELENLSQQSIKNGYTPWCMGIKALGGSGWVATDWIEEFMLRLYDKSTYDRWISHQLKFNSPEVLQAFKMFEQFINTRGMVLGGREKILSTFVEDAAKPMFLEPPQCLMHRQAEWIRFQFPQTITLGNNGRVDVFLLPPIKPKQGISILAGGDIAGFFNDSPKVLQFAEYLTSKQFAETLVSLSGFISPHQSLELNNYREPIEQNILKLWRSADTIGFDASDLMPSQVGTGSFWTGMVDLIKGKTTTEIVKKIDLSWKSQ